MPEDKNTAKINIATILDEIREIALRYAKIAIENGHSDAAAAHLSIALNATESMTDFI